MNEQVKQWLRHRKLTLAALAAVSLSVWLALMLLANTDPSVARWLILPGCALEVVTLVLGVQTATRLGWSTFATAFVGLGIFTLPTAPFVLASLSWRCSRVTEQARPRRSERVRGKRAQWADSLK